MLRQLAGQRSLAAPPAMFVRWPRCTQPAFPSTFHSHPHPTPDQYLELTTRLPAATLLFGAGERASNTLRLLRNGMPRALWNHDLGPTFLEQARAELGGCPVCSPAAVG